MVKLLSYFNEEDILEFQEYDDTKVNRALIDHCLEDQDQEIKAKAFSLLGVKKNGKNLDLTKGFALTHIRLDAVDDIKIAIGVFGEKIKFPKNKELLALFCIIIPENKCQTYLSLMAHLTRLLSSKGAAKVFRPGNKKGIIEFIRDFEEY
ncbi:MAG: PTS sugar transporter subunit IIA [Candidatus Cloacimonetes bacterium]|nr:PTS sugar transporter subunit IIA [Candidatus Cloacimonadota bacterium]